MLMLFYKAVKIEKCAACHVHSQGLCYMWIQVERSLNINARPVPDLRVTSRCSSVYLGVDVLGVCEVVLCVLGMCE